ncbi:radical SAM family RiPP maturation amino acid epimerase [Ruminococcus flavefaciens]|uniref:radical SAM family RiPP maturation amino acid epimerase n=1 Tax=Ruminococcus flavefaciens TaxID=1265 RepID=UPI000304710F|nr:radical SAM family RiPP maturation amino acid epimerase [Ruminococcus flavefaciens]
MKQDILPILGDNMPDAQYINEVALIKYFLELVTMDPDFRSKLESNSEKVLKETGIPYNYEDLRILYDADAYKEYEKEKEIPLFVKRYRGFIDEKLNMRNEMRADKCKPENNAMMIWRQRQINRCWIEMGYRNDSIIHTPTTYELDLGCSVQCEFCGIDAPCLSKVARYNENKELWRGILSSMKEILGDAAGSGTCYYATEPLDNADYELFINDFYNEFSHLPQITTAAALRNIERTKKCIEHMRNLSPTIYRCSVRSIDELRTFHKEFTPEELLLVELLPQYEGAPCNSFTSVGRACTELREISNGETIACISGFVINLAEKSIRLITPCGATKQHPTGEKILGKKFFTDIENFRDTVKNMIEKYIVNEIKSDQVLSFYPYITYQESENSLLGNGGFKISFNSDDNPTLYKELIQLILKGDKTKREIASELYDKDFQPANVYLAINNLYKAGAIME